MALSSNIGQQSYYLKVLIKRLLIVLLFFTACRLLFYFFNHQYFSDNTFFEVLTAFYYGIRFDISAILYFNIIVILLHLIPNPLREKNTYQVIIKVFFYLFNSFAILFSIIDVEYFKFTKKRMTFDVFGMRSDWFNQFTQYLKDFWYLTLIFILFLVLIAMLYRRTEIQLLQTKINYFVQIFYLILFGALLIIGVRGGIQLKPIRIIDAALYGNPQNTPLVLNTPFTMLRTYGRKRISEVNHFTGAEREKLLSIIHRGRPVQPFKKNNVVIIIVESLSREFIGRLNSFPGITPFLDSLCNEALLCSNAYSNGTRSMEALPAILASIPNLMDDSYIFSIYQGNRINSIGSILHKMGYSTSFYHGGTNGTMGFDSFIKMAGFENYYGRTEYNNDNDYDGFWGIYDEQFLQFVAKKLDESPSPFCTTIFTLSSHHPYNIPSKYNKEFQDARFPIHRAIMYTDYSLRKFFETASAMKWYENTLFIITGDHTPAETDHPFYQTPVGTYASPIIFYKPNSELHGVYQNLTQHIDIMPSILDYLHYEDDFISFGNSIFDTTKPRYTVNLLNDIYQIFSEDYILQFNGETSIQLCKYKTDSLLSMNVLNSEPQVKLQLENHLKAFIQIYNHALINNEMSDAALFNQKINK